MYSDIKSETAHSVVTVISQHIWLVSILQKLQLFCL